MSRNVFIMDGHMTTMLHPSFAFAPMGQFRFPFLTSLDLYMTVRLLILETSTTSWREPIVIWSKVL